MTRSSNTCHAMYNTNYVQTSSPITAKSFPVVSPQAVTR